MTADKAYDKSSRSKRKVAVAMKYRPGKNAAPRITAKGWGVIAEQLLARYGPFLPEQTRESDPAQWADDIPHLLGIDLATDRRLDRIF